MFEVHDHFRLLECFDVVLLVLELAPHLSDFVLRSFFQFFELFLVILTQIDVEKIGLFDSKKGVNQFLFFEADLIVVIRVLNGLKVDLLEVFGATSQVKKDLFFHRLLLLITLKLGFNLG